jgi:hypothetical protein
MTWIALLIATGASLLVARVVAAVQIYLELTFD